MVKVVLAFPLTQQSPTVVAQKTLPGTVTDVAMLLGARAAAGAPFGEIRNAAVAVPLLGVRILETISTFLA